jgi:DNA replication protein DnaC
MIVGGIYSDEAQLALIIFGAVCVLLAAIGGKMILPNLKPELLIIEDMGMKQLPKKSGEFLFEVFMRRHELRSTVMTSNRPIEDWGKLLGDVPSATAILDRFLQNAEIVTITGKSCRLRNRACARKARKT